MDFSGHMILPKGFVVNNEDIYKEVASYPVVPPEKIREYWGVYTTTFRRLIDPTANRLEHFWWHVWGSDRKYLSGETLARIFEEISTGPTIAPLPGPPNRWEPPVFGDKPPPWQKEKASNESSTPDSKSSGSTKSGSSIAKPPTPILKKSRGDSKSGPRPTARFACEDDGDDGEASSGSTSAAGVEMRRTSSEMKREKERKKVLPKKQFHASIGAKRRPTVPRRISSQTAASPEMAVKEEASKGAKHQGQRRSTDESAASEKPPTSKAAGKRPAARPGFERRISHETSRKAASNQRGGPVPQTRSLEDVREQDPRTAKERGEGGGESRATGPQRTRSFDPPETESKARPSAPRSRTHVELSPSKTARPALAAEPTASTTNIAAQGTIIDFDRTPLQPVMDTVPEAEAVEMARHPSTTSLLESKFAPTPPSKTPAVPLGRTKSQLTLLLEREKERLGERP